MTGLYKLRENEQLGNYDFKFFHYYDSPDGQDLGMKLWTTTKWAAIVGTIVSTRHIVDIETSPTSKMERLYTIARNVGPLVGMAAAFTVTTYCCTVLREKDDPLNYFMGGVAAGVTLGITQKKPILGFTTALVLGSLLTVKKFTKQKGIPFIINTKPIQQTSVSNYYKRLLDTSILK